MKTPAILREPLVHFLAIGLVLFAIYGLSRSGVAAGDENERIEVTAAQVEWLRDNWQARWMRPPTEAELRGLVDNHVRQEVLYRGALALGLDREDQIVRRRMVQKVEFMTEDLASQATPSEAELQAFLAEDPEKYRIPERRSFTQVYFNLDQRGEAAGEDAERVLADLRAAPGSDVAELGDRLMLEQHYRGLSPQEVERFFGQRFTEALFELEPGVWHGPLASGYGLHLVRVGEVVESRAPELAAVRDEVLRDNLAAARERANQAMFDSLASRYDIVIDEEAVRALSLQTGPGGAVR